MTKAISKIFENKEIGLSYLFSAICCLYSIKRTWRDNIYDVKDCVRPAKTLSYLVNSRHVTLITDAELSLLKVAQLERIYFHHHHHQQQQQRHRTSSVSIHHRSRDFSASVSRPTVTALYLVIVAVCLNLS